MKYNCQSNIGKIESILLKQPKDAFINQDYINANWKDLNYTGCPDYNKVVEEFEFFVELLKKEVSNIYYLPKNDKTGLDSIYPHDPVLITKKGQSYVIWAKNSIKENQQPLENILLNWVFLYLVRLPEAVVYSRLMPVPFKNLLISRRIKLIEMPDSEYDTMACNVLAIAPRKCIVISGNPLTKKMLEDENVEVFEYKGE